MQKIQTKLLILSLTAMLGMAVFAGMVIQAAWQDYAGLAVFQSTSQISQTAYELARNLTDERQAAYNAATFLGEGSPAELLGKYRARITASQASLGRLRTLAAGNEEKFSERFRTSLRQALEAETILNGMRQELLAPGRPQVQDIDAMLKSKALAAYDQALSAQASFLPVLSVETEDPELVRKIFTQDNVARLQKDVWKVRGLIQTALRSGRLTETAQAEIKLKLLGIDEHVARLKSLADPNLAVDVLKLINGPDFTDVMGKAARLRDMGPKASDFNELGSLASYQTGSFTRLEQSFNEFSRTTMLGIQTYTAARLVKARTHLLTLAGCSLLAAIGLSLLVIGFSRSISRPLKKLSEQLAGTAEQARQSADVIAGSSVRLSEDASEQAAALEEISASMEELSGMAASSLEQMPRLAALAEHAIKATDQGAHHVTDLNAAMQGIRKSTGAVASILKTIDEIAFQTNILALNAAVEAARAGEAGAGFSVVAEEVRALAQRSAVAARETAGKIEAAVKNTEQGAELGRLAQKQFAEISRLSGQFHGIICEVEAATRQSTEGVAQVNDAVSRVDQITQRTAGSAEQNATTAVDMQARMAAIFEQVRRLELMVHSRVRAEMKSVSRPTKPAGKSPRPRPAPALQRSS